jgi:hypothetical protein
VLAAAAPGQDNPVSPAPRVPLAFDRFYDYGETVEALRRLESAHRPFLRLRPIGKSAGGRTLWVATVLDPDGPAEADRPAMYIDANVHGNEIQGTEVCLYTIWYLLENRGRLPRIRDLLRRVVFHVVPSVNPDARESWFHEPNTAHRPRSGLMPVDEDRDGRADEDGPDDLDGDGEITRMRKRVESGGTHREDPLRPGVMVRAAPGESAPWLLLGEEGLDNDGDGKLNEDGPGGYDMNRNFPGDWAPAWIQHGAGDYPLCFPETRAVAEFLLAHPQIAAAQSYHNTGGMIIRGPGTRPPPDYPPEDVAVYDELGRNGEGMLPHYRYLVLGKDLYRARGTFLCFAYEVCGAFAFTNELWSRDQYGPRYGEDGGGRREGAHRWDEEMEHGRNVRAWKTFEHPQYGEVEIGGLARTFGRVPPPFMLQELCHRNAAFTLHHADQMPLLRIAPPEVEAVGPGLFRVRAEVRNERLIPTRSARARLHGIGLPDFLELTTAVGRVVAGGLREGEPLRETVIPQAHRPHRLRVEGGVPSRGRILAEWIVLASGAESISLTLTYRSEKGGRISRTD